MRTLAIGDVHGSSRALGALMAVLELGPTDRLVFLGDYVDRGPDSRGCLDFLIALKTSRPNTIFLRGNHELMMTRARKDRSEYRMWFNVGGAQTLASYGPGPGITGRLENVPEAHWDFLERDLVDHFETDTHIFVHANLFGELPLEEQPESMLFWEFLTGPIGHESGKTVICGHTSQKTGQILDLGDTICIDTFIYGGGWLTALDVDTLHFWQADSSGRVREGFLKPQSSSRF